MRITPFAQFQGVYDDPAHSPAVTAPDGGEYGLPYETAVHHAGPNDMTGMEWQPTASHAYLEPAIGGMPGSPGGLGWTTGLRPRRERRPLFDGRTLVVAPGQAANPNIGQVGRDARGSDLASRVTALSTDYLPSLDVIAASFTHPRGSALQRELMQSG